MTDAEILQSRYDHAHLRLDIVELVQRNTPTRWSTPIKTQVVSRKLALALIRDYANGGVRTVGYERG